LLAIKRAGFILAHFQSYVLSPSRMHVTAFSLTMAQLYRWRFFYASSCDNEALLQVAGVGQWMDT